MSDFVLPLQEWLVHSALAGGLILLAGVVGMCFIRQPARRQRLGELALLSSLLAAGLCALPAWLPYSLPICPPPPRTPEPPSRTPCEMARLEGDEFDSLSTFDWEAAAESSAGVVPREYLVAAAIVEPLGEQPAETCAAARSAGAAASPAGRPWEQWFGWLAAIYLALVGVLLLRFLAGCVGLWRLKRGSQPASARAAALFAELTRGWQRPPELRVCRRLRLPVSFGVWRSTVLVPPWFCRRGAEEKLRWILVHELTHLERRDAWGCVLASLAAALYFYQPWLWWLRRQVRLCQEYVADAAAAALASSEDYAEYLVSLSSRTPQRLPAGVGVNGVLGSPSDLFRRIAMLLHARRAVEQRCPRWWSLTAGIGFTAVAVLISGLSLRADEPKKEPRLTIQAAPGGEKHELVIEAVTDDDDREFVIQAVPDGKNKNVYILRAVSGDEKGKAKSGKKEVERKVIVVSPDTPAEKVKALIKDAQVEGQHVVVEAIVNDGKIDLGKGLKGLAITSDGKKLDLSKGLKGLTILKDGKLHVGDGLKGFAVTTDGKTDLVDTLKGLKVLQEKGQTADLEKLREALKKAQEAAGDKGMAEVQKALAEALKRVEEAHKKAEGASKEAREKALKIQADVLKRLQEKDLDVKKLEGASKEAREKALKARAEALKRFTTGQFDPKQFELGDFRFPGLAGGRLGVSVSRPSADLIAQLDMPKDQGLVVNSLAEDSAAAKAGIKPHDIIIEFNGKSVSSDLGAFIRQVEEVKADEAVNAVVLRRGKKTPIRGIKLPEKATFKFDGAGLRFDGKAFEGKKVFDGKGLFEGKDFIFPKTPKVPVLEHIPNVGRLFVDGLGKSSVITTTVRNDDRFTTRYQEGSLVITITGAVDDGKATVSSIVVNDGGSEKKFEDARKVPEQYRDKVKSLIEMSAKGQIHVEVRSKD